MNHLEKILIVGPNWVGDMIMAQSLFMVLQRHHPGVLLDVIAPAYLSPLVSRMPEVRSTYGLRSGHGRLGLRERMQLGRSLRSTGYQQAIVLPRSWKSALVPFFARIPVRTGTRAGGRSRLLTDVRALDGQAQRASAQRMVRLGLPVGAALPELPEPRLTIARAQLGALCQRLGLRPSQRIVALMPGAAFGPAKRWPATHFAALARRLSEQGQDVWILGNAEERPLGEDIRGQSLAVNLCGRTTLLDTVDLLSLARVAVSNDSGLMHVAAAAGVPVIGLYGSSSPAYTPPLTHQRTLIYRGLPCSPCFKRHCPLGHLNCLYQIEVEEVLKEINGPGLVSRPAPP